MKKEIMYTESAPEKKYLWLHYKNNNLVLEAFGRQGWESVSDESALPNLSKDESKSKKIQISEDLLSLTEKSSKQALIAAIETLANILIEADIIELV